MVVDRDRLLAVVRAPASPGSLMTGALIVATSVYPDLDVEAEAQAFERFAASIPGDDAMTIADALFGSGRLVGNRAAYYEADNSVVPRVIERGRGIPISLSIIFIEVAAHHGIDVDAIGMPGHFLTRAGGVYIDPFHRGAQLDADGCQRLYERLVGRPAVLPRSALDPVAQPSILSRMLWNLRSIAEGQGDEAMAHRVLGLLTCFDETPLQVHVSWAASLAQRGAYDRAAAAIESIIGAAPATSRPRLDQMVDRWRARLN